MKKKIESIIKQVEGFNSLLEFINSPDSQDLIQRHPHIEKSLYRVVFLLSQALRTSLVNNLKELK